MTRTGQESFKGTPCWYELGTSDLPAAGRFYQQLLGWEIADSGMEGFTYHLARADGDLVAGMMETSRQSGSPPPNWIIYFTVDACDRTVEEVEAARGKILQEPANIPDTGRFAVVSDPQGAVFGLLQPDLSQMSVADLARVAAGTGAFNPRKPGHGHWNQLMSSDPQAGFAFYSRLFGWTRGDAMDMGAMGSYQLFRHRGADIGGMMGLGDLPESAWLPYFGVSGAVADAVAAIREAGGQVLQGPSEIPGPAYMAIAKDPQGARFAMVGPS